MEASLTAQRPKLLDSPFGEALIGFCLNEYRSEEEAFQAFNKTIDFLHGLDAEDVEYRLQNRTIRRIVEEAHGINP